MTTPEASDTASDAQVMPVEWDLIPLTPKYLEAEHGPYAIAITSALKKPAPNRAVKYLQRIGG